MANALALAKLSCMRLKQLWTFSLIFSLLLLIGCEKKGKGKAVSEHSKAIMETSMGNIELEFFPDKAPKHVKNFIKLAQDDFYDGTRFHRVIPGFMIQGGDPNSKSDDRSKHGTGGPGYSIDAEFNDTKHLRGILSMARSSDPDSAGSQFFIMTDNAPHLDGQYTAFGRVTSGMDVVDKIVAAERDARDNPLEKIEIKNIIIK